MLPLTRLRTVPNPVLCTLLGLVVGWVPLLIHGPHPYKFTMWGLHGAVAVWGFYTARMLVGFLVGITRWPERVRPDLRVAGERPRVATEPHPGQLGAGPRRPGEERQPRRRDAGEASVDDRERHVVGAASSDDTPKNSAIPTYAGCP
jgi:hypothetical protein